MAANEIAHIQETQKAKPTELTRPDATGASGSDPVEEFIEVCWGGVFHPGVM
jgi:hypothetical protein